LYSVCVVQFSFCVLSVNRRWGSEWYADKTVVLMLAPTAESCSAAETEVFEAVVRDMVRAQQPEGQTKIGG
jgi:hypothetical protein